MNYFEKAAELTAKKESFAIATLVEVRGHAPQDPGAKIIVTKDGLFAGTIGGGKVEANAIQLCRDFLAGKPLSIKERIFTKTWNLQRDVGMSCGGEVEILFEFFFYRPWSVIVFGAGHVSQSLIPLLLTLDCELTCLDSRQEWLDKLPAENSKFRKMLAPDLTAPVKEGLLPEDGYYVVVTPGHITDLPVVQAIFKRGLPPYVGVIGSKVKSIRLRNELRQDQIEPEKVERLKCPMGKNYGTNSPSEISISIAADLLEEREKQSHS